MTTETNEDRVSRLIHLSNGDLFEQVKLLYEHFGWSAQDVREFDLEEFQFRVACLQEEVSEYSGATTHEDRLDALADLVVFALGTAVRHGYGEFNRAFTRVMVANALKIPGGNPDKRGDSRFDLRKPPGWRPAYLGDLVRPKPKQTRDDERALNKDVHQSVLSGEPDHLGNALRKSAELCRKENERRWQEEICARDEKIRRLADSVVQLRGTRAARYTEIGALQAENASLRSELTKAKGDFTTQRRMRGEDQAKASAIIGAQDEEIARLNAENATLAMQVKQRDEVVKAQIGEIDALKVQDLPPIFRRAMELNRLKSQDYGDMDDSKRSYHPFGHQSYLQMLHTKLERLKSVAGQETTNFESGRDSLVDLVNYACFYDAWMDEEEKRQAKVDTTSELKRYMRVVATVDYNGRMTNPVVETFDELAEPTQYEERKHGEED
jgi:predicted HAD superfamily Cof-like phosphohydrolase